MKTEGEQLDEEVEEIFASRVNGQREQALRQLRSYLEKSSVGKFIIRAKILFYPDQQILDILELL